MNSSKSSEIIDLVCFLCNDNLFIQFLHIFSFSSFNDIYSYIDIMKSLRFLA